MVTHDHGSTGIAGISYYAADQFPEAYRGTIFIGNVVTNRINHDRIEWHGSTPKGDRAARLRLERGQLVPAGGHRARPRRGALRRRLLQPDHRPLRGAADPSGPRPRPAAGSGGSSTAAPTASSRPAALVGRSDHGRSVADLIADLGHANLAVRISAANQLVERGGRRGRRGGPQDHDAGRAGPAARARPLGPATAGAARRRDPAGLRRRSRSRAAGPRLKILVERAELARLVARARPRPPLDDADPFVRRAAAEALGAHPDPANIRPLLALRQATPGRRYPPDPRRPDGAAGPVEDRRCLAGAGDARPHRARPPRHRRRRDRGSTRRSPRRTCWHTRAIDETPGELASATSTTSRATARPIGSAAWPIWSGGPSDAADRMQARARQGDPPGVSRSGARRPTRRCTRWPSSMAQALLGSTDAGEIDLGIELASGLRLRRSRRRCESVAERDGRGDAAAVGRADGAGGDRPVAATSRCSTDVLRDPAAPIELRETAAGLLAASGRPAADRVAGRGAARRAGAAPGGDRRGAGPPPRRRRGAAGRDRRRARPRRGCSRSSRWPSRSSRRTRRGWRSGSKSLLAGLPPADQKLDRAAWTGAGPGSASSRPHRPEAGAAVFEKNCAHLPPARRQGGEGRAAARRHRQPRARPPRSRTSSTPTATSTRRSASPTSP